MILEMIIIILSDVINLHKSELFLKKHYAQHPSVYTFIQLMQTKTPKTFLIWHDSLQ